MNHFSKFLALAGVLLGLIFFAPRVASARPSALPAASAGPERYNPASAHDRRDHRTSNLKRRRRERR